MKFLIFCFTVFLTTSCYQVDQLPPVNGVSDTFELCTKEDVKGPFNTFGALEENLKEYFGKYVVAPDGSALPKEIDYNSNPNYDSRVDYIKILNEKGRDESKRLRRSILGHYLNLNLASLTKDEQIAVLINAYNFFAIDIVIQNSCKGLIKSIADLGGEDSFAAFSDTESFGYFIGGTKLSLDTIEKEMIAELTNYEDARVHFAVICASAGCPVLLHLPFQATLLDAQLSFITRAGLRLPRMFTNKNEKSFISQIFDWYLDDFISDIARDRDFDTDEEYIKAFVIRYTEPGTIFYREDINFVEYDWDLNKL